MLCNMRFKNQQTCVHVIYASPHDPGILGARGPTSLKRGRLLPYAFKSQKKKNAFITSFMSLFGESKLATSVSISIIPSLEPVPWAIMEKRLQPEARTALN